MFKFSKEGEIIDYNLNDTRDFIVNQIKNYHLSEISQVNEMNIVKPTEFLRYIIPEYLQYFSSIQDTNIWVYNKTKPIYILIVTPSNFEEYRKTIIELLDAKDILIKYYQKDFLIPDKKDKAIKLLHEKNQDKLECIEKYTNYVASQLFFFETIEDVLRHLSKSPEKPKKKHFFGLF